MSNPVGLNGQWLGRFNGTEPGSIVVNIDDLESSYEGVAFLINDDKSLPVSAAGFSVPGKNHTFELQTRYILAHDPKTLAPVPFDEILPRFGKFAKYAEIKGTVDDDTLKLTWKTEIGVEGSCSLPRSKAGTPSDLQAQEMNWNEYKTFGADMRAERLIFRGQCNRNRLRTSYHRLGRAEMGRFVNVDMPMLYRRLSARLQHVFNIQNPDENGSFLSLVQHHGYPTPLLDWTYSPYVAAFFAYRRVSNRQADSADKDTKVRIFIFDKEKWSRTFESCMLLNFPKLHITLAEFAAIVNERLIPQQALTMATNIDDIEAYISLRETACGQTFLRAVDLPLSERRNVVRELNYMGITAGSMFPDWTGLARLSRRATSISKANAYNPFACWFAMISE